MIRRCFKLRRIGGAKTRGGVNIDDSAALRDLMDGLRWRDPLSEVRR